MEPAEGGRVKRDSEDESDDRRFEPKRMFHDVGPAIAEADYQPRVYGIAEQTLATAFIKMKRDYGGPLVGGPAGVGATDRDCRARSRNH